MIETVFNAFMEGWRDAEWGKACSHMQLTGSHYGFNEQKLAEMLGSIKPVSWETILIVPVSPVMADVHAAVIFDGNLHKRLTARLVCESAPFVPDENGTWGVAPLSVLTIRDEGDNA